MKIILTTIVASTIIFVGGCNKTKKATAISAVSQPVSTDGTTDSDGDYFEIEYNVEVESDGEQVVLTINGEEQVIELSDMMDFHDMGDEGELQMAIMKMIGDGTNVDVEIYSDHMGMMPKDIQQHIMQMVSGGGSMNPHELREHMDGMWMIKGPDVERMRFHPMMTGEGHEDMMLRHDQMIEMMGDRDMPEGMREMHERMMQMHDMQERRPEHMRGEMRFHNVPEEHEFMQELGMMDEMSYHLSERGAISMLGIQMIRDQLEPEARLEALERIINEAPNSSPARNAAVIVMIETYQELSMDDDAADMMVELVISNAHWDDD